MISEARLSQLADMLVGHIIMHRGKKALKIAQYLRAVSGFHLELTMGLDGYRHKEHTS